MKPNNPNEGRFTDRARGLGTVTEEMVRRRAAELALLNGRSPGQVLDSDVRDARRELTGSGTLIPEPTPAEELTEDERWKPVVESTGEKAPTVEAADEQTFAEELVEEGLEEAEEERMIEGTRASQKRDRRA